MLWRNVQEDQCNGYTKARNMPTCIACGEPKGSEHKPMCSMMLKVYAEVKAVEKKRNRERTTQ